MSITLVDVPSVDDLRIIDEIRKKLPGEPGNVDDLVKSLRDVLCGWGFGELGDGKFEDILELMHDSCFLPSRYGLPGGEIPAADFGPSAGPSAKGVTGAVLDALKALLKLQEMTAGVRDGVRKIYEKKAGDDLAEFVGKVRAGFEFDIAKSREEVVRWARTVAHKVGVRFELGSRDFVVETFITDVPPDKFKVAKMIPCPDGTYAIVCNTARGGASTEVISILFGSEPDKDGKRCWSVLTRQDIGE